MEVELVGLRTMVEPKGHRSLAESNVQKFKVELGDRWTMLRPEDWRTTVEVIEPWWI